jgi:hypothetical protein
MPEIKDFSKKVIKESTRTMLCRIFSVSIPIFQMGFKDELNGEKVLIH